MCVAGLERTANDSESVQYVRFVGGSEIDDGWRWGAHERPFHHYRIVFE